MPRQIQGSQTDFSFGEVDVALKRADSHPARKAGLRQMTNARILNSGAVQNRPGRRALYPVTNGGLRTERITMSPGNLFDIQFAAGRMKILNTSTGAALVNATAQGNGAALPWTAANLNTVVYAILGLSIYITFAGMRPQVLTWDGVATWTLADYAETVTASGQKRTPFYRISPQNITMLPSATSGAITVAFSSPIAVAAMTGTRMRYAGRQILLGSMINSSTMNATVVEPLPPAQTLTLTGAAGNFALGDAVVGGTTGATGLIVSAGGSQFLTWNGVFGAFPTYGDVLTGGTSGATGIVIGVTFPYLTVSLNTGTAFVAAETVTGPRGSGTLTAAGSTSLVVQLIQNATGNVKSFSASEAIAGPSCSATTTAATVTTPKAIAVWDEEVINGFRGYPASCFVDQFRLGFCNFPAIPGGIGWSGINAPTDLYVGVLPSSGMFEITPGKVQVLYVIPGPESNEFIFCDRRVYYIPISPTNPLKPGSVQFLLLSGDGAAQVQPRISQEAILYVNAGQSSVMAVIATGAYLRPFNTKNLSDFHGHLFNSIQAIAAPSADGTFSERYAYVLNGDGTIVVGRYDPQTLPGNQPVIGWGLWTGVGAVSWIAARAADVLFTTTYFNVGIVEILDDTLYLDGALFCNAAAAGMTPPVGWGPLWFIASQTVTLMDHVTRAMGTYQIDATGFIVPQNNGGENLAAATLVAGQPWTMTVEPFAPNAQPGADMHQRMELRQIAKIALSFINSTGFKFASLFSGKLTPTSPALGAIVKELRFPAWSIGEDATLAPPLREWVEGWTPPGSSFDPRVSIIKDTPGPLMIAEIGMEVTL